MGYLRPCSFYINEVLSKSDASAMSADKVADLGPQVGAVLGTNGGGRPGSFQGKVGSLDGLPEVLKLLHQSWQPSRLSIGSVVSHTSYNSDTCYAHPFLPYLGTWPAAASSAQRAHLSSTATSPGHCVAGRQAPHGAVPTKTSGVLLTRLAYGAAHPWWLD